ncbi:Myb protein J [Phytophthora cinnamomi]|uniref:Myb protein J n=1 Tax=Phytophthora cinnamomi TaxID=4785 RepID=UPI0035597C35|nr:Myb protein J [Phytophthora cinnamomi]
MAGGEETPLRYSFLEIKEAQRACGDKMAAAALRECGSASAAQQQIFRAHVSDLCATVFAAALRKYNPEDKRMLLQSHILLKQLETKLKDKEAAVKKLRERVPRMAAANARRELAKARKRHADVLVAEPESTEDLGAELTGEQLEALKAAYVKTASSIAITSAKLSQVMSQTTETISIVEQAMKRPKTEVDIAMENSPVKARTLLNEQEMNSLQQTPPLRTRLALQLSASKNV